MSLNSFSAEIACIICSTKLGTWKKLKGKKTKNKNCEKFTNKNCR